MSHQSPTQIFTTMQKIDDRTAFRIDHGEPKRKLILSEDINQFGGKNHHSKVI